MARILVLLILVGISVIASAPSRAQERDYLAPSEVFRPGTPPTGDSLTDYQVLVATFFEDAYAPDVAARVVVEPSNGLPHVVGLRRMEAGYVVFGLEATQHLWGYGLMAMMREGSIRLDDPEGSGNARAIAELDTEYPDDFRDVPMKRCEAPIADDLAAALLAIWSGMLEETTERTTVTMGGTSYRFEMGDKVGSGEWTWDTDSAVGKLVHLVVDMTNACEASQFFDDGNIDVLGADIGLLLEILDSR